MSKLIHSIVVRIILIITIMVLVLGTTLFSVQVKQQNKMYMEFFEQRLNQIVDLQIQELRVAVRQASLTMEDTKNAGMNFTENINFMQIRQKLNALLKEDMEHMYLLSTKIPASSTLDNPHMTMIQGDNGMDEQGFIAGSVFPMDEGKMEAVQKLKTNDAASTKEYTSDGKQIITTLVPITNEMGQTLAYLGVDYDYSMIKNKLNDMLWSAISICASIELLCIVFVAIYISLQLRPLNKVRRLAEQAAEGDLTVRLHVKGKDEFSRIGSVVNQMIERLNGLLHEIQVASKGVSQSTIELARGAEETALSATEVSAAMQQVASGAQMQQLSAEETKRAMMEIAAGVHQITETSTNVLEKMEISASKAENGRQIVNETVLQMERIQEASDITYDALQRLSNEVNQISEAVHFIQGVVKQTELLALNASIEAARAGEHGKGFQVVATEVRKLADSSKTSLNRIMELIAEVHTYRANTERAAKHQKESVEYGLKVVRAADDAFMEITTEVMNISEQVKEGSVVSMQMSAASEEVTASLEQLSEIASQSHSSSERVAAATEEQSAMTEQIRASVDQLQSLSTQLEAQIAKFKVSYIEEKQ
ncbi:methyl-accepting chemotaxis protein [Paenibacillus marinisediminis]